MPRGLRITFCAHAVVALFFGVVAWLRPALWAAAFGWEPFDAVMVRGFGAALIALGVGSCLAYRAADWQDVRILVQTEIAFCALSTVGALWAALFREAPAFLWFGIACWVVFGAAWTVFYARARARETGPRRSRPMAASG